MCSSYATTNKTKIDFQAYHFHRDDIALLGHYKYFQKASDDEREHAKRFMEYLNKRGGRIVLTDVEAPEKQEWGTAVEAMHAALELEKRVNEVTNHLKIVFFFCLARIL